MRHRTYGTARFSPISRKGVSITSQTVDEDYQCLVCGILPDGTASHASRLRGMASTWGTGTRPSSPGGRPPRGRRLPLEKLADLAPCQDQIDKVIENQDYRNTAIRPERLGFWASARMPEIPPHRCGFLKRGQLARVRQPAPSRTNRKDVPHVPPNRFRLRIGPRTRVADDRSDKRRVLRCEFECPGHSPTSESNQRRPEEAGYSRKELRERSVAGWLPGGVRQVQLSW